MDELFAGGGEPVANNIPSESNAAGKTQTKPAPAVPAQTKQPLAPTNMRFEEAFARLEALVGEMERGELPLEQMLDRFEEGVRLVRHCNQFLGQAQLRVEKYVEQKDGHWVLKELESKE